MKLCHHYLPFAIVYDLSLLIGSTTRYMYALHILVKQRVIGRCVIALLKVHCGPPI